MQEHVEKIIQKRNEIASAIIAGIKEAGRYDKPWDKQETITLFLDMAGYKIVKKPKNA